MPTPEPQSVVNVQTYENGKATITVTGKSGTLTLEVFNDDPNIVFRDPRAIGRDQLKAVVGLKANGRLKGFFIEKGDTPEKNHLVWFPARKKRTRKRQLKKQPRTKA